MTREEIELTIDYLKNIQEGYIEGEGYDRYPLPEWYALNNAIEALEQEPILDNIRDEIEQIIREEIVVDSAGGEYERIVSTIDPDDVLEIIDKYKAESEW